MERSPEAMLPHRAVAQVIKCPAEPPVDLWESSGGPLFFKPWDSFGWLFFRLGSTIRRRKP